MNDLTCQNLKIHILFDHRFKPAVFPAAFVISLLHEERAELLQIEREYNKDGRPECKQVVVGQIVNEAGIPVLQKVQNGSTPNVSWNARAIDYLRDIQEKGFQYGVFVADSRLVTHDLVASMNAPESRIPFVSRCPSNFEGKLEERCILKAYSECPCDARALISTTHRPPKRDLTPDGCHPPALPFPCTR